MGEEGAHAGGTTSNVDLNADTSLLIDISDALSERDKVKFTVHTKVRLIYSLHETFYIVEFFSYSSSLL